MKAISITLTVLCVVNSQPVFRRAKDQIDTGQGPAFGRQAKSRPTSRPHRNRKRPGQRQVGLVLSVAERICKRFLYTQR